jgi:MYXO-CTERM domain-containing protein
MMAVTGLLASAMPVPNGTGGGAPAWIIAVVLVALLAGLALVLARRR